MGRNLKGEFLSLAEFEGVVLSVCLVFWFDRILIGGVEYLINFIQNAFFQRVPGESLVGKCKKSGVQIRKVHSA